MMRSDNAFSRLSTPLKLLLALSIALLPIGALIVWSTWGELEESRDAVRGQAQGEMITAARAAEALIARNALALRVAAYGALQSGEADPCAAARESLSITPALDRDFLIRGAGGEIVCGDPERVGDMALGTVPLGNISLDVAQESEAIIVSVGIPGATAAGKIDRSEFRAAVSDVAEDLYQFSLQDGDREISIIDSADRPTGGRLERAQIDLAGGRLSAAASIPVAGISTRDRILIFLPVLMWALAALLSWYLVHFLLIRPLRRLNAAVRDYDFDSHRFELPDKLGPAREIRDLGGNFAETFGRIEEGERQLIDALEGQRRLIREVHHRVKNNLQVVASLLNIHSRGAVGDEAKTAYTGIGRRVEALAVVHRNHFAEIEDSRGIQLRPLLTELAASLRASAADTRTPFELNLDAAATTQDAAVSAAFFVTEVVEHALNRDPVQRIEVELRRTSELTARLSIASEALMNVKDGDEMHRQFERIVDGLSRQLRSPLDKRVGSYSVEIPVFPEE